MHRHKQNRIFRLLWASDTQKRVYFLTFLFIIHLFKWISCLKLSLWFYLSLFYSRIFLFWKWFTFHINSYTQFWNPNGNESVFDKHHQRLVYWSWCMEWFLAFFFSFGTVIHFTRSTCYTQLKLSELIFVKLSASTENCLYFDIFIILGNSYIVMSTLDTQCLHFILICIW